RQPSPGGAGAPRQYESRPPSPGGAGAPRQYESRPPSPGGAGAPRQYEGRPPRPGGAGAPRQYESRPPRPGGAAQGGAYPSKSGFGGKDKDSAYEGRKDQRGGKTPRQQGESKAAMPGVPEMKYAPSPIEKPSANYRQEKKVFTKDIVFERASTEEKELGFSKGPRGAKGKNKRPLKKEMPPVVPKKVIIPEYIVLADLAKSMGKTAAELIKRLFGLGIMATINQELDSDAAILLGAEFGITVEVQADRAVEIMEDSEDEQETLAERPPVVTVMGHVDHGKTSLLDAIRQTNVIATEAGGITQHIGAYQVEINNKKITFLDTPGHEAFTAMRARGAQVTDISILVVAADDGVMPQTVEAINHSRAAGVPIIVAINKIDKPTANPSRVKQSLMDYGLVAEEWGGEDIMVPVSAKKGEGIENLLEMILLVAEVQELKANPKRHARGTVVEAELDKNKGPVATLLVQKGTLKVGDSILAGAVFGKVRAMNDDKGRKVRAAGPSMPVEVMGFSEAPPAGEIFIAVKDDKDARLVAYKQQVKKREEELRKSSKVSLEDLFKQISQGEIKELNIILKADVQGSVEALSQAILKLNTDEVKVKILHAGVGGISESDIMLASASNAIIIGFNIRPDNNAKKSAEQENVDVRLYRVIYDATNDIKKAMTGLLAPQYKEQIIGHAQVRTLFKVPKAGMIAGSYVTDGKILRSCNARVLRDLVVIMEGKIESLRRFKEDVKEVASGFECGIGLENFNDIKENDIIEAFIMEEVKREL
ncbi:MAG: translation initiation factor IF-2, partial [Clostridiales bacterium]|nr:translation initiation factor IF-2 [Clostridiales bacterium]